MISLYGLLPYWQLDYTCIMRYPAKFRSVGMLQDFSNSLDCKDLCTIKKLYTSSFEKYLIRRSVMKRYRVTTFQSGEFHVNLRHIHFNGHAQLFCDRILKPYTVNSLQDVKTK